MSRPPASSSRVIAYLANNASACVALALAILAGAAATAGALLSHETRHTALSIAAEQSREDRRQILESLSKLDDRQERTLSLLLEMSRARD